MTPLADYLCRDNDVRLSLRCSRRARTARPSELLENDEEVYALSELLDRAARGPARSAGYAAVPRHRGARDADGTAILPSLSLDRFGQTAPSGTAVFTKGKLSCFLDGGVIGGERFA